MNKKTDKSGGLVYSSEYGRMCPECGQRIDDCICKQRKSNFKGDGIVRVRRETKGRAGKFMTIITGVPLNTQALSDLAKELKRKLGTGGTVKDGIIEIQGDHREHIIKELEKYNWTVKLSGG